MTRMRSFIDCLIIKDLSWKAYEKVKDIKAQLKHMYWYVPEEYCDKQNRVEQLRFLNEDFLTSASLFPQSQKMLQKQRSEGQHYLSDSHFSPSYCHFHTYCIFYYRSTKNGRRSLLSSPFFLSLKPSITSSRCRNNMPPRKKSGKCCVYFYKQKCPLRFSRQRHI